MTAASRERFGNGTSSVMHSSINIANEYVSECIVAEARLSLMSSGAEYLTVTPDDTVFEIVLSLASSTIFAIPKSQICGLPLPVWSAPDRWAGHEYGIYLVRDKHIFLRALSQQSFTRGMRNSRI